MNVFTIYHDILLWFPSWSCDPDIQSTIETPSPPINAQNARFSLHMGVAAILVM